MRYDGNAISIRRQCGSDTTDRARYWPSTPEMGCALVQHKCVVRSRGHACCLTDDKAEGGGKQDRSTGFNPYIDKNDELASFVVISS